MSDNEDRKKTPFCKPVLFSGKFHENVNEFSKKIDRASIINKWTDTEKIKYLPMYLASTALIFFENLESKIENITWETIDKKFRLEFEPVAHNELLRTLIDKKKTNGRQKYNL